MGRRQRRSALPCFLSTAICQGTDLTELRGSDCPSGWGPGGGSAGPLVPTLPLTPALILGGIHCGNPDAQTTAEWRWGSSGSSDESGSLAIPHGVGAISMIGSARRRAVKTATNPGTNSTTD